MSYLLDTNIFIQAKNEYYGFDICPGFWNWLEEQNRTQAVFSIDPVAKELRTGKDELADWSKRIGAAFFFPLDNEALAEMPRVINAVEAGDFRQAVVQQFMKGADPFLVAFALAHDHTIVTHEVHVEGQKSRVKIPTLCRRLSIPSIRTFDLLRKEKACFVLSSNSDRQQKLFF